MGCALFTIFVIVGYCRYAKKGGEKIQIYNFNIITSGLIFIKPHKSNDKYCNGNHWVTVYQYYETGVFTGYYKCIDNWGVYNKQINSSRAMGAVKVGY